MTTLKTLILHNDLALFGFFLAIKNYIAARYVAPANLDRDTTCNLNLISLEIVNSYFPGKNSLLDPAKYPGQEAELRTWLLEAEI